MQANEVDPRLIEDLVYFYVEKKRLSIKNYNHRPNEKDDKYLLAAAKLCMQYELDAASYVQLMYERMGEKKEFFSPMCLQGTKAAFALEEQKSENVGYKIEITNASLEIADIWRQQTELAMVYIRLGEDSSSVLMDSSLKFFAWFRILSTPNRVEPVITKYKHIARKELNSKIMDFAKSEGLDIDRILG